MIDPVWKIRRISLIFALSSSEVDGRDDVNWIIATASSRSCERFVAQRCNNWWRVSFNWVIFSWSVGGSSQMLRRKKSISASTLDRSSATFWWQMPRLSHTMQWTYCRVRRSHWCSLHLAKTRNSTFVESFSQARRLLCSRIDVFWARRESSLHAVGMLWRFEPSISLAIRESEEDTSNYFFIILRRSMIVLQAFFDVDCQFGKCISPSS